MYTEIAAEMVKTTFRNLHGGLKFIPRAFWMEWRNLATLFYLHIKELIQLQCFLFHIKEITPFPLIVRILVPGKNRVTRESLQWDCTNDSTNAKFPT